MASEDNNIPVVTIDGPSGAGKGTICRLVAKKMGYHLLDSGALYRLTALSGLKNGADLNDENQVAFAARNLNVSFTADENSTHIMLDAQDVSQTIRQENVGMGASIVAAHAGVREALLQRQRDFLVEPGLVADGRDMGTVVFPNASVKFFLTASAEERARRRVEQLRASGSEPDYEKILKDIQLRDKQDSSRSNAPLVAADDAVILDSTSMSIQEVFAEVMSRVGREFLRA